MKYRLGITLFIILCLTVGCLIYVIFRPDSIYLNQWIDQFFNGNIREELSTIVTSSNLPHWIIYSLPDALWMVGLTTLVLFIWDFKLHKKSIPWVILAFLTGIFFELLQRYHIIRGTFDIIDLTAVIVAALIPLSLTFLKQFSCKTL